MTISQKQLLTNTTSALAIVTLTTAAMIFSGALIILGVALITTTAIIAYS